MKDRGIALLLGLVLLASVSLLALMAVNGMVLQRRMSANFGSNSKALAQADRASAAARAWLDSRADFERESGCTQDCLLPLGIHGPGEISRNPEYESSDWWQANAFVAGIHPETGVMLTAGIMEADPPRWIIEEIRYEPISGTAAEEVSDGIGYYRVFARGSGGHSGSLAFTESIIARPWGDDVDPLPYPTAVPLAAFCRQFEAAVPCGMQAWRQRR